MLVNYELSDSEGEEDEKEDNITSPPSTVLVKNPGNNKRKLIGDKPQGPKKICIPALPSFENDEDYDDPNKGPIVPRDKRSALLELLPPPKMSPVTTTSFVPTKLRKPVKVVPKKKIVKSGEDDDEDHFDEAIWQSVCGRRKKPVNIFKEKEEAPKEINAAPEIMPQYSGMTNESFKKLVTVPEITIVPTDEDEIIRLKALTDPEIQKEELAEEPVNNTAKKKGHITYLAQQAKATEQELANQWAKSRFSRQMTRSKYGFL